MTEGENRPDITIVSDGLFRGLSGMAQVVYELMPDEAKEQGPFRPDAMTRALVQARNGSVTPEMNIHLAEASRLRQLFDRAVPLTVTDLTKVTI